jgi:hypothetical protein
MFKRPPLLKNKRKFHRKESFYKPPPPHCGVKHKVSYETFKDAERFIHKALKYGMVKQRVYKCKFCPYYHLTSQL